MVGHFIRYSLGDPDFPESNTIQRYLIANFIRSSRLSGVNHLTGLMLPDIEPRRSEEIATQLASLGN